MGYMKLQTELADCRHAYDDMKERAVQAEAALASCQHDLAEMIEREEVLRNCWEMAEQELASVPVDALRKIAEREKYMLPPTPEYQALAAWLAVQPTQEPAP